MTTRTPEQFRQEMVELIWKTRWEKPTAWDVYLRDHLTWEGARVFALEHCAFADHFPRWFGNIIANCPHLDVRQYMIENMYVEEVNDPTIQHGHYESLVDFAEALGHDREFVYKYQGRVYTRMALAYWDWASRTKPWLEAFAAVAGLEAVRSPDVARLGNVTLSTRESWASLGLSPAALAHFDAGKAADVPKGGHGDETLTLLTKYADTAEKQDAVLTALEESRQVWQFRFELLGRDAFEASKIAA